MDGFGIAGGDWEFGRDVAPEVVVGADGGVEGIDGLVGDGRHCDVGIRGLKFEVCVGR